MLAAAGCGDGGGSSGRPPAAQLGLTERLPAGLRAACRRVRAACPPLIPAGPWSLRLAKRMPGGYYIEMYSPRIHASSGGHWAIGAGRPGSLDALLHPSTRTLPPRISRQRTRLGGVPATHYRVPNNLRVDTSMYRSHVVYVWMARGVEYYLTLHGLRNDARARVMARALAEATAQRS